MADEFCLKMPDFHVTFRDLLHAINLRHGTNGFTSFPKEGVRRAEDFFALKNPTASAGFEPANLVPKASTLPLDHRSRCRWDAVNPDLWQKAVICADFVRGVSYIRTLFLCCSSMYLREYVRTGVTRVSLVSPVLYILICVISNNKRGS